jgi:hypothetical protein
MSGKTNYQIHVHIIEGRDLEGKNTNKMSDPIAQIRIGPTCGIKQTTSYRENTLNVVWDDNFLFDNVGLTEEEFQTEQITIEVVDRQVYTKNQFIGSFQLSLSKVYREQTHHLYRQWFTLTLPDKPAVIQGYLLCSVYVLAPGDPTPTPGTNDESEVRIIESPTLERTPFVLNVMVYKAKEILVNMDRDQVNPFVAVRFNGNTIQTEHKKTTHEPVWDLKLGPRWCRPSYSADITRQI